MFALAAIAAGPSAWAQAQPGRVAELPPPAETGRTVYGADFFARFNPSTAEDILRLIPGAPAIVDSATSNQQARGLGAGGARVLLNGQRFPGKANDLAANLRRIPGSSVERVEMISGAAAGINVQSEGLILNVMLKEGASIAGSGAWEANVRFNDEGRVEFDGLLSYNGNVGALGYSLGVERNVWSPPTLGQARYSDRFRDEVYFFPNGSVAETRPQYWNRDHDKWIYTGSVDYDFLSGAELQLNAFYQTLDIFELDTTDFTRFNTAGAVTLTGVERHERATPVRTTLELGGEYEAPLGPGDLRALFIVRRDSSPSSDYRVQDLAAGTIELSRSLSRVDTGEDILRTSYTFEPWSGQSLEFGVEGARNTLDQNLRVFRDPDGDGQLNEALIPTAEAEVEEVRGEAFAMYRGRIGALSLESSLTYEASRITNNYTFVPERELSFLKPRLDARYRAGTSQYRLLVERTVSQLDFNLFVPRYDFVDNEIDAGNPWIEPEKTWVYELGYERRLADDAGLIEARVYYRDITDAIDKVPLVEGQIPPQSQRPPLDPQLDYFSADGNLPSAEIRGAEIKGSFRLAPISLPDAQLSLRFTWQESETTDPFTGETRKLRNDFGNNYEIGYRQDLTDVGLSYGFTYTKVGSATILSDLSVREYFRVGPVVTAFVEKKLGGNLALRVEAQNLTGSHEDRTRYFYAVDVMGRQYQHWDETRDLRVAVRLRGRF